MADYYSLIAKAVTSLQSAQSGRALYKRGRNALLTELEAVSPPLRKSIVTKERIFTAMLVPALLRNAPIYDSLRELTIQRELKLKETQTTNNHLPK